MTNTYNISGMTCGSCVARVQKYLSQVPSAQNVKVSLETETAEIESNTVINFETLELAVAKAGLQYGISEKKEVKVESWFSTYYPLLLIFGFITGITSLIEFNNPAGFSFMNEMRYFMAGFFIVFSFFKFLNIKAFANSYQMYDIVAKQIPVYGFVYPFIELGLGIAYLLNFSPFATNLATLIVMSVGSIGVLMSLLNKQKIQCACLGTVFQLPMSKISLFEDILMVGMAAVMLIF